MSSPVVTIELTPQAKALLARAQGAPERVLQALRTELDRQNELTIGYAQKNKLSGPRPEKLGVVTSRLRNSLRRNDATISGTTITGAIGSNVKYAAVHEYGFDGDVQVKSFVRHLARRDVFSIKRRKLSAAGISVVRPFTRHMHMPARSFLHSSLNERRVKIGQGLSHAVVRAMEGAGE